MRSALALIAVALLGLFGATSIGYAAYVVSRDSVGLPVTKLKLTPSQLAPAPTKPRAVKPKPRTTSTVTTPPPPTTTTDDHHRGRGKGSDDSDD
jgi:hypothetical protein